VIRDLLAADSQHIYAGKDLSEPAAKYLAVSAATCWVLAYLPAYGI
jgi:hypothetical protein